MAASKRTYVIGYGVMAAGLVLAFASAVVPHYSAGHRLLLGVLMAGLTPYLAYGLVVAWLRRTVTSLAGVVLLAVHTWLVVSQRFVAGADYSDGMIYYVPLGLTVLPGPLVFMALRESWGK